MSAALELDAPVAVLVQHEIVLKRHIADRAPRGHDGFSWGRFTLGHDDRVCYRLFRREVNGKLHMESRTFDATTPRATIAFVLWDMRARLREAVDLLDLKSLGLL